MDQVRAAIFSSLADQVAGTAVLDLFAGTGGFGIEALSRGARTATFVEKDRRTLDCIRQNLVKTRLDGSAEVVCAEAFAFCARLARQGGMRRFDLIFADPPYQTRDQPEDFASRLLSSADLPALLAPDGIFVLEKSPKSALDAPPRAWQIIRQKRYGTAEVVFLQRLAEGLSENPCSVPSAANIEPL